MELLALVGTPQEDKNQQCEARAVQAILLSI